MSALRAAAVAGGLLLLATGCRGPQTLARLPAGDPRPAAALSAWDATSAQRQSLRGRARLAVDVRARGPRDRDLRLRSRQSLVVARPARLRVEVQLFLTTAAVLATDGETYDLFQADGPTFESGPVHDGLLWEVARLQLTPAEAVDVILGVARPAAGGLRVAGAFDVGDGRIRIELADATGDARRRVDFDAEGRLRRLEVLASPEGPGWTAAYDDFAPLGTPAVPFAHRVEIGFDEGRGRAVLLLSEVELDPVLPEGTFRLDPPPSTVWRTP